MRPVSEIPEARDPAGPHLNLLHHFPSSSMADKELTVFIVDALAPWGSYDYLFHVLAAKLLKGLKTDYVSVVAFNAAQTNHSAMDSGKFIGVNVLVDFEVTSFNGLKSWRDTLRGLCRDSEKPLDSGKRSDAIQTVLFCSQLFKPTVNKVFTRNIVLLASKNLPTSAELVSRVPQFYADVPSNLYVILEDEDVPGIYESLRLKFMAGQIISRSAAADAIVHHHPVKKIRPVAAYKGQLRLGADFSKILHDASYLPENDELCASFDIDLIPAVKSEAALLLTHDYLVDNQDVVKLKRVTSHYILEKLAQTKETDHLPLIHEPSVEEMEKFYEKVPVDSQALTAGFKFSNFDLIALDEDLLRSSKLKLHSGLDIFGFVNSSALPQHLFTGEPFYAVPEKTSLKRNITAFMAFVEALFAKNLAALCRFVRRQEKEVEIGAMFPVRITRTNDHTPSLLFIRLPFKEDEKIGNFPPLSKTSKPARDSDDGDFDDDAVNLLMEEFIESKTAHEAIDDMVDHPSIIDNPRVTMLASKTSKLPLPPRNATRDPLLCTSPWTTKFHNYLQKVVLSSLDTEDWVQHFTDPKFIEKNLRGKDRHTNFFTLANCMAANSSIDVPSWLGNISKASSAEKRLVELLDIKYELREDSKKQKTTDPNGLYKKKGNYGADEGDYGQIPDFGL